MEYTYVRARQLSSEQVQFTILSVEGDRVVVRGLTETKPAMLEWLGASALDHPERMPTPVYVEIGANVGIHSAGAPPLLIEQLYEQCEAEIRRPRVGPIRMYFHPSGVLMQCGRAASECPNCPTISIQSYGFESLHSQALEYDASHWACTVRWGLLPPLAIDWVGGQRYQCQAPELQSERITRLRNLKEDCLPCDCVPRQCDKRFDWPTWTVRHAEPCPTFLNPPGFLDVGKSDPDAPFKLHGTSNTAIDCSGPNSESPRVETYMPPDIDQQSP